MIVYCIIIIIIVAYSKYGFREDRTVRQFINGYSLQPLLAQ